MHQSQAQAQALLKWYPNLRKTLVKEIRKRTGYDRLTEGRDLSEVTHKVLRKLDDLPDSITSRAGNTKELSPHLFHIPSDAYGEPNATTILPGRGNNVFATIAETLWVYAGRNDIITLKRWLPRAVEFSDDGKVWSSGYGPRIRSWINHNLKSFDQIEAVLRRLKAKADSRQAVIVIWDPAADGVKENSKDYACNIFLHFLIRDGGLNMYVTTRSNDIIFGVAINVFEWCFLGRYLATELRIPFRNYYQTGSSLHLYDWKGTTAKRVLETPYFPIPVVKTAASLVAREEPRLAPKEMQAVCGEIYHAAFTDKLVDLDADYFARLPSRIADCVYALWAETKLDTSGPDYLAELQAVRYPPLLFSLLDVGMRRRKEALWLCKGFNELFADTANEIAAARYLKRLYKATVGEKVL